MSVVGNALRVLQSPEVPDGYEELQYIQLVHSDIGFPTKRYMEDFSGGLLRATTKFYCTNYSSMTTNYANVFTYGRRNANFSAVQIRKNGYWIVHRARRISLTTSAIASLNSVANIELYDTAGTQWLKVNGTTVVTASETADLVSPGEFWIGVDPTDGNGQKNLAGRYYRVDVYDFDGLFFKCIPVRRKADGEIGFLTTDRYGNRYFGTAQSSGTIASGDVTAGPVVT